MALVAFHSQHFCETLWQFSTMENVHRPNNTNEWVLWNLSTTKVERCDDNYQLTKSNGVWSSFFFSPKKKKSLQIINVSESLMGWPRCNFHMISDSFILFSVLPSHHWTTIFFFYLLQSLHHIFFLSIKSKQILLRRSIKLQNLKVENWYQFVSIKKGKKKEEWFIFPQR